MNCLLSWKGKTFAVSVWHTPWIGTLCILWLKFSTHFVVKFWQNLGGTHTEYGLVVYGSASFFLNFTSSRSLPKKTISCTSVVYTTIRCCEYRTKIYRATATALLPPPPSPPPRKLFSRRHLLSSRGPPRLLTPGLLQQPSKKVSHRRRETPDTVVTHIKIKLQVQL